MVAICKSVMLGIALHPSLPLSPGTLRVGGGRRRIRGGGGEGGGGGEDEGGGGGGGGVQEGE